MLEAIYAAFTEGWTIRAAPTSLRRDLTEEALFMARLVTTLMPEAAEAMGLLALMLHAEARRRAGATPAGDYVPFADQDPGLWDGR